MNRPFSLLSRLSAVALLVLLVVGAYLIGINPLVTTYRANEIAIAEAQALLGRFGMMAMGQHDLEQRVQELTELHASEPYYLTRETDALAAVELQDRVSGAINKSGGTIRSIQPLPPEKEDEFQRVTLRVQLTTTIESLFHIVYELETTQPFLFLGNVEIKSRPPRIAAEGEANELLLTVTLDLYGYQPPEAL
jgi:general secretion pathway protein M